MEADPLSRSCEMLIVGGGVNGAAIAREAALAGIETILIDAEDLAAGTSAASSRLIHGGIRYLENLEFRLVSESLHEREHLLRTAPHLVKPFGLLIPFYKHNLRSAMALRTGMILYDILSLRKTTPKHRVLSRRDIRRHYPGVSQEGLGGGALYFDAQAANAERLNVELAVDAATIGATVLTHVRATALRTDAGGIAVTVKDELSGDTRDIVSSVVINAAGPWVDSVLTGSSGSDRQLLIRGTKGSHLVVGRFPGAPPTGVHYEARSDHRAILVLPEPDGKYVIGSTDIFTDGETDVVCTDDEVRYLLDEVNALIPTAGLTPDDVLHTYSGIRPLPRSPSASSAAEVSRDHALVPDEQIQGLYSITGGKLTTHRALAQLVVRNLYPSLRGRPSKSYVSSSLSRPLPGARCRNWSAFRASFLNSTDLDPPVAERLLDLYGTRATEIVRAIEKDPSLGIVIEGTTALVAEIDLAFREEFARTLVDLMARRLLLTRRDDAGLGCVEAVARAAGAIADWDGDRRQQEIDDYLTWVSRLTPRVLADQVHRPQEPAGKRRCGQ